MNTRKSLTCFAVVSLVFALSFSVSAQQLLRTVTVGTEPRGVAINQLTSTIYVANVTSGSISVIQRGSVTATIPVDTLPFEVTVNPITNLVYATGCNFFTGEGSKVVVIDGRSNQVVKTIVLNQSCSLGTQGIAANALTNRIYVSDYDESQEVVIDGASNEIATRIDLVGALPTGVAIDLATNKVWVTLDGPTGNVAIIDGASNTVANTITLGNRFVQEIAINPFSHRAYIAATTPSSVVVVNTQTETVVASVPFGSFANAVDVDVLSNLVFVTDGQGNQVGTIDGRTNTLISSAATSDIFPSGVAADPVTQRVFVTNFESSTVDIYRER